MGLKTPLKLVRKDNGVCYMGQCEHEWYEIQDREGNPIISNFEYEHPDNYLEMKEIVEKVNEYDELKRRIENQRYSIISYEEELQEKNALIRELTDALQELVDIIENSLEGKYKIDSFTTQYARKLLEKAKEVE